MQILDALASLEAWAAAPHDDDDDDDGERKLQTWPPEDDLERRRTAPRPRFGRVPDWQLPPSYRAFLAVHSGLLLKWGADSGHQEFLVFRPNEMKQCSAIVYLPEGVSRGVDAPELSTNHLVPFASAGNDECAFCFDVTQAAPDGEYPVYFHHQDHARARIRETLAWEDPADATPDFPSFAAWLRWVAAELGAGREPESSSPQAFMGMPGRAGPAGLG